MMRAPHVRSRLLGSGLLATALAPAQAAWTGAFDHDTEPPLGASFDPFPGASWPFAEFPLPATFLAVHLALIPKGPYRGMVLAWNSIPAVGIPGRLPGDAGIVQKNLWSFQPYAVVDPRPGAAPRCRNFLLPINEVGPPPAPPNPRAGDLFCAGHSWSRRGDLVVAGATFFGLGYQQLAGRLTFSFDPSAPYLQQQLPGAPALFAGSGRWLRGVDLAEDRYYPTVTFLAPDADGRDHALALGGAEIVGGSFTDNSTWNSYECLELLPDGKLEPEHYSAGGRPVRTFAGPGRETPLDPAVDMLLEYPRTFLLSDGTVFTSGWAPESARIDHRRMHPQEPGQWDVSTGRPGSLQFGLRNYGSSVLFPNLGGQQDVVLRLGGRNTPIPGSHAVGDTPPVTVSTATVEACAAGPGGGGWVAAPPMHTARHHCNAVILPDASILVVGGQRTFYRGHEAATEQVYTPERFVDGVWEVLPPGHSPRDYHSTALLLPDGRVLVAGGEGRHMVPGGTDYEVFAPSYLAAGLPRPKQVTLTGAARESDGTFVLLYDHEGYAVQCLPLPLGVELAKAVLIAPGSVTHHSDMGQRYFELTITAGTANERKFRTPANPNALPPGYYMLFAVTSGRVPSEAVWVRVGPKGRMF